MDHLPKGIETDEHFLSNYTYLSSNYRKSVTEHPIFKEIVKYLKKECLLSIAK